MQARKQVPPFAIVGDGVGDGVSTAVVGDGVGSTNDVGVGVGSEVGASVGVGVGSLRRRRE